MQSLLALLVVLLVGTACAQDTSSGKILAGPFVGQTIPQNQVLAGSVGFQGRATPSFATVPQNITYDRLRYNVAIEWSDVLVAVLTEATPFFSTPVNARATFLIDLCMYEALVPFSDNLTSLMSLNITRRPASERTEVNQITAVSVAAYHAMVTLFGSTNLPSLQRAQNLLSFIQNQSQQQGNQGQGNQGQGQGNQGMNFNLRNLTFEDLLTPLGIGNYACRVALDLQTENRTSDIFINIQQRSNFTDPTNYFPVNDVFNGSDPLKCQKLRNFNHWSPLPNQTFIDSNAFTFNTAVVCASDYFHGYGNPPLLNTNSSFFLLSNASAVANASANLTDFQKASADFWNYGPNVTWPGDILYVFTIELAKSRNLSLTETMRLFMVQATAENDASIVLWSIKRLYDYLRPVQAIQCGLNQTLTAWRGPYMGVGNVSTSTWIPYLPSPPFPEFISGHSVACYAGFEVLRSYFGSDEFNFSFTVPEGMSRTEPRIVSGQPGFLANVTDVRNQGPNTMGYSPASNITLSWATFSQAAEECARSRIYGGVHFPVSDLTGREVGADVASAVWDFFLSLQQQNQTSNMLQQRTQGTGLGRQ